jgi:hypothetical protein
MSFFKKSEIITASVSLTDEKTLSKDTISWSTKDVNLVNINDSTMELSIIDVTGLSLKITFNKTS